MKAIVLFLLFLVHHAAAAESFPVTIRVNAAKPQGDLKPIWRFFGADEPNYAYMKHGKKLVGELGEMSPKRVYFRAHNLLSSGDGLWRTGWSRAPRGFGVRFHEKSR